MNFPLISEYVEAVKMAEDNFDQLSHLRPVLDKDGQPIMSSGNFAVVFKMQDANSGKFYAVRCFHREQEGRAESYKQIEEALQQVQSPYLVSFRYMDKELFVDSKQTGGETEFPVLLMDWVEGVTLDRYIREHINDKDALEILAYHFSLMASWLIAQPFAHGDLKPDNILVRQDGSIALVDYDGMFVPSMQGQSARELGSPDFRHPLRKEADFDGSIDDFPLISILLSLKAIVVNPSLLDQFGASDRLLFSEADYRNIANCRVLYEIFPSADNELNRIATLFNFILENGSLHGLLVLEEPICMIEENLSTEVTDEDLAEAIEDEYGVKYSKDGKRLLKGVEIKEYRVREGTRVICNEAFSLLDVCMYMGDFYEYPVENCLTRIYIPDSVTRIGYAAFVGCFLQNLQIPDSVTIIDNMAFQDCSYLETIRIPNSVTKIGREAFRNCQRLTSIDIPYGVKEIEGCLFKGCTALANINISCGTKKIGDNAFNGCEGLTSFNIPESVTEIGERAFKNCWRLTKIDIPNSVTKIGSYAFEGCLMLTDINMSDSIVEIGRGIVSGMRMAPMSIYIPYKTNEKFAKLLPEYKNFLVER